MPSTEKNDVKSSSSSTTSADEKARVNEVERAEGSNSRTQEKLYNAHIDVSGVDERKLMRKLDWWLVPWLSFLYLLSFLDRTSIGNAKVSLSHVVTIRRRSFSAAVRIGGRPAHQRHPVQHRFDGLFLFIRDL